MRAIKGQRISTEPIHDLRFVRNVIYFDGPLLSEYTDKIGQHIFYRWCDCDETANRWMIYHITGRGHSLIKDDDQYMWTFHREEIIGGTVYIADFTSNEPPQEMLEVKIEDLPASYIPDEVDR